MATLDHSPRHSRSPFSADHTLHGTPKNLPVLSSSTVPHLDSMDLSSDTAASREGHSNGSPRDDRHGAQPGSSSERDVQPNSNGGSGSHAVGAAAAAQQPKAISAAFIHKLYSMLEDQSIQHLISWSSTNESFVMSPSTEFSKVLASYFKHTNISSFVRQLNMYGFHKVSDVFHTGSPDSPLWEFKHGNNNFRRGDLNGLRDIKRRASRHTLIHRDSFSNAPKMAIQPPPPPPPGAPMEPMPDPVEARLSMLEFNLQDVYARMARTEDAYASLSSKCQTLSEGLSRCHYWSGELSSQLLVIIPDPENPVHRDVSSLRAEINRQAELLRTHEIPIEMSQPTRITYTAPSFDAGAPVSPRQQAFDPSRRPSLQPTSRNSSFRTPMPPHLTASPRRYGSISGSSGSNGPNGSSSPSSIRPPPAFNHTLPPPALPTQSQQSSAAAASAAAAAAAAAASASASAGSPPMSLLRRHTSADIRLQGWQGPPPPPMPNLPTHGGSPYASGQNSSQWPSSPYRQPANAGDQQLRDALAQYELPRGSSYQHGRQVTPPPEAGPPSYANPGNDAGWQLPGPKFPFKGIEASAPPTRRGSMASNVHSLLNPAETAEREGEDEGPEERKRKRMF